MNLTVLLVLWWRSSRASTTARSRCKARSTSSGCASSPAARRPSALPGLDASYAHLTDAEGEATKPKADTSMLVSWAIYVLAPWLLAAIVLALVFGILRAAGRGDPFSEGAARRLNAVGILLLLGIPAIAIEGFLAAELSTEGLSTEPYVEPALTLTLSQFLPGILVLALVGIFRRGVELRDLEQHTI